MASAQQSGPSASQGEPTLQTRHSPVEMDQLPSSSTKTDSQAPPPLSKLTEPTSPGANQANSPAAIGEGKEMEPNTPLEPSTSAAEAESGPEVKITLLLSATSARHEFTLDRKYLRRRNVQGVQDSDPFNLSVLQLKQLIMRDWRDEWEPVPDSASYIRLISFGRMLDDSALLKDCPMKPNQPNVVHMSIRPATPVEDEGDPKSKTPARPGSQSGNSQGCGCCTIL